MDIGLRIPFRGGTIDETHGKAISRSPVSM